MSRYAASAQLLAIPSGAAGTRATLKLMAAVVRHYRKQLAVRQRALQIVSTVAGHKNWWGMVEALHAWVQTHIQYVQDVRGTETVQTPDKTLAFGQGDCDDQSVLLASLLESIGFHSRFVAIRVNPGEPFSHVFTEVQLGREWWPLETTEPWPAGRGAPRQSARMVQDI